MKVYRCENGHGFIRADEVKEKRVAMTKDPEGPPTPPTQARIIPRVMIVCGECGNEMAFQEIELKTP